MQSELSNELTNSRGVETIVRFHEPPLIIEVPHPEPKPLIFDNSKLALPGRIPKHSMLLGRSYLNGYPKEEVSDFGSFPHTLVAAMTDGGKSVLLQGMVISYCERTPPSESKWHLIDLKNEDLVLLQHLPHVENFAGNIEQAELLIEHLYELLLERIAGADSSVRQVIVIDELAQLSKEAIQLLEKITALGRSKNMYVIAATQQPLARAIGSIVKANFSQRLVGVVGDNRASVIACGRGGVGAEFLPGKGAFLRVKGIHVTRFQSYYYTQADVSEAVDRIRKKFYGAYQPSPLALINPKLIQAHKNSCTNIEELAQQEQVKRAFERYYDPRNMKMRHGGLSQINTAIFGEGAHYGGWHQRKTITVVDYLMKDKKAQQAE